MANHCKATAVALFLALGFARQSAVAQHVPLRDWEASRCAGLTCTIEGAVAEVSVSDTSGTTFLYFGAAYPRQTLTAVIYRYAAGAFPDPKQWEGKRVRVTGTVEVHRGKPEIVLVEPSQLRAAP